MQLPAPVLWVGGGGGGFVVKALTYKVLGGISPPSADDFDPSLRLGWDERGAGRIADRGLGGERRRHRHQERGKGAGEDQCPHPSRIGIAAVPVEAAGRPRAR